MCKSNEKMKYHEGGSANTSVEALELVQKFIKGYKISRRMKEMEAIGTIMNRSEFLKRHILKRIKRGS